jgi:peroxiredoxin Q/BCP
VRVSARAPACIANPCADHDGMLEAGTAAPAFTLPDQDGKPVALNDLKGRWVVLYFYPKDDTPGCTVEACEFTAAMPEFRGLDAEVFGCSADGASAHLKFIAKHKLGIRLLTDADKKVMKTYGAFGKKMMYGKQVEGVIRSTVLIAPDGSVAHHWATVKAAGHAEQVRSKLAELQGIGAAAVPVTAKQPAAKKATARKPAAAKASVTKPAAKKPAAKKPAAAKKTAAARKR